MSFRHPPATPPEAPSWTPSVFDDLEYTLKTDSPEAACRRLCDRLREEKDYHALFYALLMQKRHELGVSPVPTGPIPCCSWPARKAPT